MRWRLKLSEHDYEVIYKPGTINTNADALSRLGKVMLTRVTNSNELLSFQDYQDYISATTIVNQKVKEEDGDLFEAPTEFSYALCVSQNLKMNKEIALMFRRKISFVETLKCQHPKLHEILYLKHDQRYIFYLVTKVKYWQKMGLEDLYNTFKNLYKLCTELNINKFALPRNGSGYDELNWEDVQKIIKYIFRDLEICINIILYSQSEVSSEEKQQIIIVHHMNPLGGHRGIEQTYKRVQMQFYWANMKEDIKDFVEKCKSC